MTGLKHLTAALIAGTSLIALPVIAHADQFKFPAATLNPPSTLIRRKPEFSSSSPERP